MVKIEKICFECGEKFPTYFSYDSKFCSRLCYKQYWGKNIKEKFISSASEVNKGKISPNKGKTYDEIYGEKRAKKIKEKSSLSHKGQKAWNKGKHMQTNTGKTHFKKRHAQSDVWKEFRKNMKGVNHPNYKEKIKVVCKTCGNVEYVHESRAKKFRYCSNKCYGVARKEMIPHNKGKTNVELYGTKKAKELEIMNRKLGIRNILNSNKCDTSIERKVENYLLFNDILYVKQYKYEFGIADFWLPESNTIIECDGDYFHNYKHFPQVEQREKRQKEYLENNDFIVLRFKGSEILNNFDSVISEIKK